MEALAQLFIQVALVVVVEVIMLIHMQVVELELAVKDMLMADKFNVTNQPGGDGGGAGAAGASGTNSSSGGGQGGVGVSSTIDNSATYRGGGGSGCALVVGGAGPAGGNGGGGVGKSYSRWDMAQLILAVTVDTELVALVS